MEAMHKQVEIFRKYSADIYGYAEHLESLLDDCRRQFHHPNVDYRATRPPDPDILLDDNEQGSNDGYNPTVMVICIPPQGHLPYFYPSVLNNAYPFKGQALHPAFSIPFSIPGSR